LALIEVLIPLLVVTALTVSSDSKWRGLSRSAPLIVAPLVWAIFAISEYTRSWVYYQMTTSMPFIDWVTTRLAGYYVTSFNNSAMFVQAHADSNATPYFSIPFIWNAPGVDAAAQGGVNGFGADEWWTYILNTQGSKDFTNVGSFLVTYGEFGMIGMIVFWLVAGLIVGGIFSKLTKGGVPSLIAYASIFVGILELPRFIYWTQGRATPILIAILVISLPYPPTKAKLKAAPLPSWASSPTGQKLSNNSHGK